MSELLSEGVTTSWHDEPGHNANLHIYLAPFQDSAVAMESNEMPRTF